MDSNELIELFYNRAYEKFVNKQILDDKNYIVPRQQLKNYVHELVNIPYIDFINYIKQNEIEGEIKASDITQFSSFSACEIEMCNALIWTNNPGCQFVDIGRFFPDDTIERSDGAYRRYGENHIKAATQLGLTFEYYGYWYLSCLGYIYPDLDKEVRKRLLARTIIRNRLYRQLVIDLLDHDVNPKGYIIRHSGYHFKRCLSSTYFFLEICLNICRKENVKIHHLIRRSETHQEMTQDEEPLKNNERTDKYLFEIGRQELLSIDEEIELAQKIRKGKIDARNKLVSANMRFVVVLAKQYLHKGLEFEDLLHEGFLGLIKAAECFDETRGFKFISYASWWIRRYLSNAIVEDSSLIKYPLSVQILHRRIWDFKIRYEQQNGFMPSIAEIEIEDEDNLERISFLDSLPNNLKNTCIPYEDFDSFVDNHNDILDYENNERNTHYVRSLLAHLSKRERDIIIRVYGIGVREETLETIGDTFGLTRERVRQIKEKAIRKLKEIINTNGKEQDDHVDEEPEEIETTIGEIERRKRVHSIINKARKNKGDSSANSQKGQYKIVNKDKVFEIRDANNNLLFFSIGNIKSINGDLYCLRSSFSYFNIYTMKVTGGEFKVGELIIHALKSSHLYQLLIGSKYDKIKEIIQDYSKKEYKVFVDSKWYDNSGLLLMEQGNKFPKESELSHKGKDKLDNVTPVLIAFNELDGIKVGDRIIYDEKECTICKIFVRGESSRFSVKYDNNVLDYVSNDKSRYRIVPSQTKLHYQTSEERKVKSESRCKDDQDASVGRRNDKPNHKVDNLLNRKSREELYDYYTQLIMKLNQATVHGVKILAKPALLVAIIDTINDQNLSQNRFVLYKWFEEKYKSVLSNYTCPNTRLTGIEMPFWYLQSDHFWHLKCTEAIKRRDYSPTKKWLLEHVEYGSLDDDFWYLLQDKVWRKKVRDFIIEQKLLDKSACQNYKAPTRGYNNHLMKEKKTSPKYLPSTSLNDLVRLGIITNKQLKHCYKKGLRTIGDVKKKIDYYHLTPDSTRFTKYTLDMWFGIVALLNNNV